jgi:hypothetical protein
LALALATESQRKTANQRAHNRLTVFPFRGRGPAKAYKAPDRAPGVSVDEA